MRYSSILSALIISTTIQIQGQIPSSSEQRIRDSINHNNSATQSRVFEMQHNQTMRDLNHSSMIRNLPEERNLSAPGASERFHNQINHRSDLNAIHSEEQRANREAIREVQRRGELDSQILKNQLEQERRISESNRIAKRDREDLESQRNAERRREMFQVTGGDYGIPIQNNIQAQVDGIQTQVEVQRFIQQAPKEYQYGPIVYTYSTEVESKIVLFLIEQVKNGSANAAYDLYQRYTSGNGVIKNQSEAGKYLNIACERGNREAQKEVDGIVGMVSILSGSNQAVQSDKDYNNHLYSKLKKGSGEAAIALAMRVKNGNGFNASLDESRKLIEIAARLGNPIALEMQK